MIWENNSNKNNRPVDLRKKDPQEEEVMRIFYEFLDTHAPIVLGLFILLFILVVFACILMMVGASGTESGLVYNKLQGVI